MAEKRSAFRFRLPWLTQSAPAPRPPRPTVGGRISTPPRGATDATATATATTQRPPFRPPGVAPVPPPPPPTQSSLSIESEPKTTENPITVKQEPKELQPITESLVTSSKHLVNDTQPPPEILAPTTPPQTPQLRPPRLARNQAPPNEPSHAGGESQVSSQLASPSHPGAKPQVNPQPQSPSRMGTQSQTNAHPATPSRKSTPSRISPKPSSPSTSRGAVQSRPTPRPPSSLIASQPADKIPSSPAIIADKVEAKDDDLAIQPLPSGALQQTAQTSSTSNPSESQLPAAPLQPLRPEANREDSPSNTTISNSQNEEPTEKTTIQANITANPDELPPETKTSYSVPLVNIAPVDGKLTTIKEVELDTPIGKRPSNGNQNEQNQPEKQENPGIPTTKTMISHPTKKTSASKPLQNPTSSTGPASVSLQKEIRDDISKFVQKMATTSQQKHPMAERGKSLSVITIAGENQGAFMHLGSDPEKGERSVHIHRGYKTNPDESAEATTDGEGSAKGRRAKEPNARRSKAYVNSNIQGINNSMVYKSSIAENNPGVHILLPHTLTDKGNSKDKTDSTETHKAEFSVTPSQKLTYETTIRRRCLRGLFLESSDSDPDNPEKPRRHGCRYKCGEKSNDNEIEVA